MQDGVPKMGGCNGGVWAVYDLVVARAVFQVKDDPNTPYFRHSQNETTCDRSLTQRSLLNHGIMT
jgi:hypothetical protein